MAGYFLDTSAIVKRYVAEIGTVWVQNLVDPATSHKIHLAGITAVEMTSAVVRRQRGGSLSPAVSTAVLAHFRQDLSLEYRVLEVTPALLANAVILAEMHGLRAYDAVQLAAALELNVQRDTAGLGLVTLVSADRELNAAATASGLLVEDPNTYP